MLTIVQLSNPTAVQYFQLVQGYRVSVFKKIYSCSFLSVSIHLLVYLSVVSLSYLFDSLTFAFLSMFISPFPSLHVESLLTFYLQIMQCINSNESK